MAFYLLRCNARFGIKGRLKRLQPQTAVGFKKSLVCAGAQIQIGINQAFNRRNDLGVGKSFTRAVPDCGGFGAIAAKRDLVAFDTGAIQSKYTDVANVMMWLTSPSVWSLSGAGRRWDEPAV